MEETNLDFWGPESGGGALGGVFPLLYARSLSGSLLEQLLLIFLHALAGAAVGLLVRQASKWLSRTKNENTKN
jgi:cytochrome bd-type quinol oxidase subunit 2